MRILDGMLLIIIILKPSAPHCPWKDCLPQNQSLVLKKKLGTADLYDILEKKTIGKNIRLQVRRGADYKWEGGNSEPRTGLHLDCGFTIVCTYKNIIH